MNNVAIDLAAVGTAGFFVTLSVILGMALAIAGSFLGAFASFIFGLAEAIAGGRSDSNTPAGGVVAVAIRAFIYLAVCFTAILLAAFGHSLIANVLAVAGGVSLGIALVKLVSRLG